MPRLSDSMEEGTILAWKVGIGDAVEVGQEIAEIETDKANMGYEADVAGTVLEIRVAEGETAAVGAVIAVVGEAGGAVAAAPAAEQEPEPKAEAPSAPADGDGAGARVKASPLARRLARERGIELSALSGSGPGGRIVKADVEGAGAGAGAGTGGLATSDRREEVASPPVPSGAEGETAKGQTTVEEPSRLQQTIARRMSEAKATAPHFYLTTEVEMTRAVEARKALKARAGEGETIPSFNDMVVKACAIALREIPKANGAYRDGKFELYSRVNVGVAVAAPGSLVVPTIFDADRKGLRQIATEARALAAKVRDGSITPPELSGATFTVSNLGMYGITEFEAVINLPQAAILAVGAISERPVFREGEVVPAHLMKATVSCDHRILYGAEGAAFLARVRELLEEPLGLAL
jgi:pyruvate dehydrogenase E2 component (dihydrolipoamide acetyltransferase)